MSSIQGVQGVSSAAYTLAVDPAKQAALKPQTTEPESALQEAKETGPVKNAEAAKGIDLIA